MSQASATQTCPHWTNSDYSSPAAACAEHGCMMAGSLCITPSGGAVDYTNIKHETYVNWKEPGFDTNENLFWFTTEIPQGSIYQRKTEWEIFQLGTLAETPTMADVQALPPHCTSWRGSGRPADFAFTLAEKDTLDFQGHLWVQQFSHLDFSTYPAGLHGTSTALQINSVSVDRQFWSDPEMKTALEKSFGPVAMRNSGSMDSPLDSVSFDAQGEKLGFLWGLKLATIIDCPGVVQETHDGYTVYVIPTSVLSLSTEGGLVGTSHTFRITQTTSGSITVSPNSRYTSHTFIKKAHVIPDDCQLGHARLSIVYETSFSGVGVGLWVGPKNMEDVRTLASNTFEDSFRDLTRSPCVDGVCTFQVESRSQCRLLTADRLAFKIPDSSHSWEMDVWMCTDHTDMVCNGGKINLAASGASDLIIVSLPIDSVPPSLLETRPEIIMGILDSASSTDWGDFHAHNSIPSLSGGVLSSMWPLLTVAEQQSTRQISWKQPLTVVVRLYNENLADLRLGTQPGDLEITALNADRQVLLDQQSNPYTLNFDKLKLLMEFVPKNTKAVCPTCKLLPILNLARGNDGFSIPTIQLINNMGTLFSGLRITARYHIGDAAGGNAAGARRLLSVGDVPSQIIVQQNPDGSILASWSVFIDREGIPGWNPSLTYWNETGNVSVTVPLNPKPIVIMPAVPALIPKDSEISLIVVLVTAFIVDVVLTMGAFFAVK